MQRPTIACSIPPIIVPQGTVEAMRSVNITRTLTNSLMPRAIPLLTPMLKIELQVERIVPAAVFMNETTSAITIICTTFMSALRSTRRIPVQASPGIPARVSIEIAPKSGSRQIEEQMKVSVRLPAGKKTPFTSTPRIGPMMSEAKNTTTLRSMAITPAMTRAVPPNNTAPARAPIAPNTIAPMIAPIITTMTVPMIPRPKPTTIAPPISPTNALKRPKKIAPTKAPAPRVSKMLTIAPNRAPAIPSMIAPMIAPIAPRMKAPITAKTR